MPGASPTSLTLRYLREQGCLAQVVERWVPTRDPESEGYRKGMLAGAAELRRLIELAALSQDVLRHAAEVIERAAPAPTQGSPGRRVDLFGLIDILCLDGQPGCLGVQCCAYSGVSAHLKEIREGVVKLPAAGKACPVVMQKVEMARRWLSAGNRLSIFGWRKVDGKWTPRIVEITTDSLGG